MFCLLRHTHFLHRSQLVCRFSEGSTKIRKQVNPVTIHAAVDLLFSPNKASTNISNILIDVRSPSEYKSGHIPGSHNLPLFSDDERAVVGTTYKQVGSDAAVRRGLQLVSPKLNTIVEEVDRMKTRYGNNPKVFVHCWRGGMRSSSVAWLLTVAGYECYVIEGGYKAFRNWALNSFQPHLFVVVLSGGTGSGKTAVLQALRDKHGQQVIDLETLANHRGSAFGHLNMGNQPTQEMFENTLAIAWYQLQSDRAVWMENESKMIGRLSLPPSLYDMILNPRAVMELNMPRNLYVP